MVADAGEANLLGLGYGSDEEDGSRLALDDADKPEEVNDATPRPAVLPDSIADVVSAEATEKGPKEAPGPSETEDGKDDTTGEPPLCLCACPFM